MKRGIGSLSLKREIGVGDLVDKQISTPAAAAY
jgi:hypothetical protein